MVGTLSFSRSHWLRCFGGVVLSCMAAGCGCQSHTVTVIKYETGRSVSTPYPNTHSSLWHIVTRIMIMPTDDKGDKRLCASISQKEVKDELLSNKHRKVHKFWFWQVSFISCSLRTVWIDRIHYIWCTCIREHMRSVCSNVQRSGPREQTQTHNSLNLQEHVNWELVQLIFCRINRIDCGVTFFLKW